MFFFFFIYLIRQSEDSVLKEPRGLDDQQAMRKASRNSEAKAYARKEEVKTSTKNQQDSHLFEITQREDQEKRKDLEDRR